MTDRRWKRTIYIPRKLSEKEVMEFYMASVGSFNAKPATLAPPRESRREPLLKDKIDQGMSEQRESLNKELGHNEPTCDEIAEDSERAVEGQPVLEDGLPISEFIEEVKILFIPGADQRLICYFLGTSSTTNIKTAGESDVMMIGMIRQQALKSFMASRGYRFAEEVNMDDYGNRCNVQTHTWKVNRKPVVFTCGGYLFFEHESGDKSKNVVMFNRCCKDMASTTCFATNEDTASSLINELDEYAKKNNVLRGLKMRDIDMFSGHYDEVNPHKEYSWETFYYPQRVIDLFELEVFGFLNNTKKYNDYLIEKRGILMHGRPGTGKTSIGYIVCNYAKGSTVIWVTPDLISNMDNGRASIKLMYKLADYLSPAVIILEDIDLFTEDRDSVSESVRLGTLMNILDGVNSIINSVTIAMTNRLDLIEKALSNRPGRFDRIVEIPELDKDLRKRMLESRMKDCFIADETLDYVVDHTDGWTGAQIQEFVLSVNMHFIKEDDRSRNVTLDAAKEAIEQMDYFSNGSKRNGKARGMGFHAG